MGLGKAKQTPDTKVDDTSNSGDETVSENQEAVLPANACPDCKGQGIRNPAIDHQVCQTCEGTGKV